MVLVINIRFHMFCQHGNSHRTSFGRSFMLILSLISQYSFHVIICIKRNSRPMHNLTNEMKYTRTKHTKQTLLTNDKSICMSNEIDTIQLECFIWCRERSETKLYKIFTECQNVCSGLQILNDVIIFSSISLANETPACSQTFVCNNSLWNIIKYAIACRFLFTLEFFAQIKVKIIHLADHVFRLHFVSLFLWILFGVSVEENNVGNICR